MFPPLSFQVTYYLPVAFVPAKTMRTANRRHTFAMFHKNCAVFLSRLAFCRVSNLRENSCDLSRTHAYLALCYIMQYFIVAMYMCFYYTRISTRTRLLPGLWRTTNNQSDYHFSVAHVPLTAYFCNISFEHSSNIVGRDKCTTTAIFLDWFERLVGLHKP